MTALDDGAEIDYFTVKTAGILYNKFFLGIFIDFIWGRAFIYAFFQLYLNLEGHQYNGVISFIRILWAVSFIWGVFSDAFPILRKRRIPYMIIGWVGCLTAFVFCALLKNPEPFYFVEGCHINKSIINNPSNVETAAPYAVAIAVATCMLSIADVASDALVIEYNRREPITTRGQATTLATLMESFGRLLTIVVIGVLMNGPSFNGIFCWEITISQYFIYLSFVCIAGIFTALFTTVEECKVKNYSSKFLKKYLKDFWVKISEKEFVKFCFFIFIYFIFFDVESSATVKVKSIYANVTPVANTISNFFACLLFTVSMYLYKKYFINVSWRKMLCFINCFIVAFSLIIDTITIFDWIRNPYFYCSEGITKNFSIGILVVLIIQVCAELTSSKFEGLTFGLFMSVWTAASPIALVIGNILSAKFDVSNDSRYFRDSASDRWQIFSAILVCKFINICGIIFLFTLLTDQKVQMQENIKLGIMWPRRRNIFVFIFLCSLIWIIITNVLTLHPSTSCYILVGGSGC